MSFTAAFVTITVIVNVVITALMIYLMAYAGPWTIGMMVVVLVALWWLALRAFKQVAKFERDYGGE